MLYFIIFLLLMNIINTIEETNRNSTTPNKIHRRRSFAALIFSNTRNLYSPKNKDSCQWLSRLKHQSKICKRYRGLAAILLEARKLAVFNCQEQFEYKFDQWNCSKREQFFKKIYRETAFMYSIASSAIMYSIAKACANGTFPECKCGEHGKQKNDTWEWGGCADNSRFAKRFTKRFLQLRKKNTDIFSAIMRHNSEVGMKIVMANEKIDCKCHGVSGSCAIRICTRRIKPFEVISKELKALYHNAIQVQPTNNIIGRSFKNGKSGRKLLYVDKSPNFCLSTADRHCNDPNNCATLCCGKGYYNETRLRIDKTCKCHWTKPYKEVGCHVCVKNETIFKCV